MADKPFQQLIHFSAPTNCGNYGRSGTYSAHGLLVGVWGGEMHLEGISSRGHPSPSARLSVPFDNIDSLITALIAVRDGA